MKKFKYPFEQINARNEPVQYAICPACLNPIQLIGLVKRSKCKPYGKHAGRTVNDLPAWNQYRYEYCPFATNKRAITDDASDLIIDDSVIELYELVRTQFDRIVYVLKNKLCFDGFYNFWQKSLNRYLSGNGYCYPWLNEMNLPYIFGFRGFQHMSLIKQKILVDSDLYFALKNIEGLKLIDLYNPSDKYKLLVSDNTDIDVTIRFSNHEQTISEDDDLNESIRFCIDLMPENREIFSKTIPIDDMFVKLVNSRNNEQYRGQTLLQMADKTMPTIKPNT